MRTIPFFKRISEQAIQDHLGDMILVEKRHHEIIFPEKSVVIILNGRVILRRHERNPLDYRTIASYTHGQILGFDKGDDGMCKDCDVWVLVASKIVQYIEITQETFSSLWRLSLNPLIQVRMSVLQQFEFFNRML